MDILLLLLFFMIIFAILGEFPAPQAPGGLQKPFAVEEKFTSTVLEIQKGFTNAINTYGLQLRQRRIRNKMEAPFVSIHDLGIPAPPRYCVLRLASPCMSYNVLYFHFIFMFPEATSK